MKRLLLLFVFLMCILGCENPVKESPYSPQAPHITPGGGNFTENILQVEISAPGGSGDIFWTNNGTTPDSSANRYTGAITIVEESNYIQAVVIDKGSISSISSAVINLGVGNSAAQSAYIKGRINIPEGANAGFSDVSIYTSSVPNKVVIPDSTGRFIFDGLDPNKIYTFFATTEAVSVIKGSRALTDIGGVDIIATQLLDVKPSEGAGADLGDVKLMPPGTISGKVERYGRLGTLESDLVGSDVYIPGTSYFGKTDENGNISLSNIPAGLYDIRIERSGYVAKEVKDILVRSEQDTSFSPVDAVKIYYSGGTVIGTAGYSDISGSGDFSGIQVLLKNMQDSTITYSTNTTVDGSYSITDVEPGTYFVQYSSTGYQTQNVSDVIVAGAEIKTLKTIYLAIMGGELAGVAKYSDTDGSSNAGTTVLVEQLDGSKSYSTVTNEDGAYNFNSIPAGSYRVNASRVGYSTRSIEPVVIQNGIRKELNFETLVKTKGTITGAVSLEGLGTASNVQVVVTHVSDATISYSVATDVNGIYIVSDVEPGKYNLSFSSSGFITKNDVQAEVKTESIVSVPLVELKSRMGRIKGSVLLESALDNSGVSIVIIPADAEKANYTAATDIKGDFYAGNIEPGTYSIQASKSGYVSYSSDPFSVSIGTVAEVPAVTLAVALRSISGKVTLEGSANHAGITVTATNLDDSSLIYSALTNSAGLYALASMQPGTYLLNYSKTNYVDFSPETVDVSSDGSAGVPDATLVLQRGNISGIAVLEGRTSSAGITVTLPGTSHTATTNADGTYLFTVPAGNYPGGVRFECSGFQTSADTETITVLNQSTYAVPSKTLAATHNRVHGSVELKGSADHSDITVSIEGTAFSFTTTADGAYSFDTVPLGSYRLIFTKLNTPAVSQDLNVIPADSINMGKITMVPNAASVHGFVSLDGKTDHSGIKVSAVTAGITGTINYTTDADGYFELGNLLATGNHTITISKNGWDSQVLNITDLSPLEERDLTGATPYVLVDTTAPVISKVSIGGDANMTSNPDVEITITANETGSFIDRMQVSWTGTFDQTIPWEPYKPAFTRTLPDNGNGERTVHIRLKDYSGNVSAVVTDDIMLTDQVKTYSGVLSGPDLHWTADGGIIRITGNVLIEEGDTLVIDPGVEIQFDGDYYIKVAGAMHAYGTAAKSIKISGGEFRFTGPGNIQQDGYKFTLISGSELDYVVADGTSISGGALIRRSTLDNVGEISGILVDSNISHARSLFNINCIAYNCRFNGNGKTLGGYVQFINCSISNYTYLGYDHFTGQLRGDLVNCDFYNIISLDLIDARVRNSNIFEIGEIPESVSLHYDPVIFQALDIEFSNISAVWKDIFVSSGTGMNYSANSIKSIQHNFWGYDKVAELTEMDNGGSQNLSFIYDYYDDFELAKVDVSGWQAEPWDFAGYQGDRFCDFDFTVDGITKEDLTMYTYEVEDENLEISISPMTSNLYADGNLIEYRVADTVDGIKSASWQPYMSNFQYTFEPLNVKNDIMAVYVQVQDAGGRRSAIKSFSMYYDQPDIDIINLLNGTVFTSENEKVVNFSAIDKSVHDGRYQLNIDIYINNILVKSGNKSSFGWDYSNLSYTIPLKGAAVGNYELKITATDTYGRSSTEIRSYSINRTVDDSQWGLGQTWNADGTFIADSNTYYYNDFNNVQNDANTTPITGGLTECLSGYISSITANRYNTAFTAEMWFYQQAGSSITLFKEGSGLEFYSDANGCIDIRMNGFTILRTAACMPAGEWVHAAVVADNGVFHAYVNGTLVASVAAEWTARSTVSIHTRDGYIDEMRLSDKVRSGDEIKAYVDYIKANISFADPQP